MHKKGLRFAPEAFFFAWKCVLHGQGHDCFLRVEAIFRFVEDDGVWPVDDFGADFFAAMCGQAVHEEIIFFRVRY